MELRRPNTSLPIRAQIPAARWAALPSIQRARVAYWRFFMRILDGMPEAQRKDGFAQIAAKERLVTESTLKRLYRRWVKEGESGLLDGRVCRK